MDNHLHPAPAEERETPVEPESVICDMCGRMVFWNALAHRICIEDGQVKVLACHSVIAEDRAVTAPQEPEHDEQNSSQVTERHMDGRREDGGEASERQLHGWEDTGDQDAKRRMDSTEVETKFAALTHAVEALRGEYANRQPGTVSSDSIFADKLAAILKEWEGRHA
jgi:hypothetical protein